MKTLIMTFLATVLAAGTLYGWTPDQPPTIPSEEQPEVLTRGPVNEAFAQPVNLEEDSGFIAPKAPPADIEEIPPSEAPEGEQYAWIPGYWAWDSDRDEYIWISGCWRAVPSGKYWVPGYWAEVENGWRWVAGFWASVSSREIEYLPRPPAVAYTVQPGRSYHDKIWVPPCWYWSHGHYTFRAGYWIEAREDWVWVPSHYIWTPRGYVFVNGYWDYPLYRRGLLFAPVYFSRDIYRRFRYSFSLSIAVDIGSLEFALFTRPGYSHYYFGDYYDSFYVSIGIFPWFDCLTRHTWYDPVYLHDYWRHRKSKPDWQYRERREYARRKADKNLRPPVTYREMERRVRGLPASQRKNIEVAAPLKRIAEKNRNVFKLRYNKQEDRERVLRHAGNIRKDARERNQRESRVNVRETDRNVKKQDSRPERGMNDVKNSRPVRPKAGNQEAVNTGNATGNIRARTQRGSTVDISVANRTAVNTDQPGERRIVRKPTEHKTRDFKTQRSSEQDRERGRSFQVTANSQKGSPALQNNKNPSNPPRMEKRRDKPENVKIRSSSANDKKKGTSLRKKPAPRAAEELEKPEEQRRTGNERKLK